MILLLTRPNLAIWAGYLSVLPAILAVMALEIERLAHLAGSQHGVLSRSQALGAGLTARAIQYRTRRHGPWQRILPAVYLTVTGEPTQDQREMAALLYAGPASLVTGAAALARFALRKPQTADVDVLLPASVKRVPRDFALLHRTRDMPEHFLSEGRIRFVLPARAVADAVRVLSNGSDIRAVVAGAVQQRHCTVSELARELARRPGRGTANLRAVLAEVAGGVRSSPEGDLHDIVRDHGLPKPLLNHRLYVAGKFLAQPDAWWPQASLAVEVDSKEWHLLPEHWEQTMRRRDRMTAAGLFVLSFSPRQLRQEPEQVARLINAALQSGRPATQVTTKPPS